MILTAYKAKVEQSLNSFLAKQITNAPTTESKLLLKRISQQMSNGKRFRPSLFYLIYKAYNGKGSVVNIGVAIELLHQALLIHDDLIDKDTLRHNKPNIQGMYLKSTNNTDIAYSMGLLAGDLCLSFVTSLVLNDKNLSPSTKLEVLDIFQKTLSNTIYGQQLDSLNINSLKSVNKKELFRTYLLKSAIYTTVLPMNLAITLVDIPQKEIRSVNKFAEILGIYYQLVNDHYDYFKLQNGRYSLSDFSLGKITYPYILSHQMLRGKKLDILNKRFAKEVSYSKQLKIVDMLKRSGVEHASREQISKQFTLVVNLLSDLQIKEAYHRDLLTLISNIKV
ncbi:MAG: polyprenyl synthetase family protein [Candidatus Saccharimonadales bacterium]